MNVPVADAGGARLPGRRGLLHPRAQGTVVAGDRAPRQPDRRGRRGARRASSSFLAEDLDHMVPILVAIAVGSAIGVPAARRVAMTADAAAGRAVQRRRRRARRRWSPLLELDRHAGVVPARRWPPALFTVLVGAVSFAGSCVTFAKLQELMTTRPVVFPGGPLLMAARRSLAVGVAVGVVVDAHDSRSRRGCWCCSPCWRSLVGRAVRAAGRRRRRADRHLAAQRVHRPHGRGERLRARQRAAARRRHAGRAPAARS